MADQKSILIDTYKEWEEEFIHSEFGATDYAIEVLFKRLLSAGFVQLYAPLGNSPAREYAHASL